MQPGREREPPQRELFQIDLEPLADMSHRLVAWAFRSPGSRSNRLRAAAIIPARAIRFPAGARLWQRMRERLVKAARAEGLSIRQSCEHAGRRDELAEAAQSFWAHFSAPPDRRMERLARPARPANPQYSTSICLKITLSGSTRLG